MSNAFTMTTGQAHEVAQAFGRNGWDNEQVKKLSEGDFLRLILDVLVGRVGIKPIEQAVDFGANPFLPDGWKVEEHHKGQVAKLERKGDDLYIDSKKIEFWLSREQKRGVITGNILRAKLKGKPTINANLLDHLLKNPHLIPEAWKKDENGNTRYIFFWGTILRGSVGFLYVRCLCWGGERWVWFFCWLGRGFYGFDPAALAAS